MEIYFNELSINNLTEMTYEQIENLKGSYLGLKKEKVTSCRISVKDSNDLLKMMEKLPNRVNIKNFYYSFFKLPFESEIVDNNQEEYIRNKWKYKDIECLGPAMAWIVNSMCLSLYQEEWNKSYFGISKNDETIKIRNVSRQTHVGEHKDFFEGNNPIELLESSLDCSEKEICLRDDHGKKELMELAQKIVKCKYVEKIVNSLPFNPHDRNFIRKVKEDGLVEIVMIWTDRKYGMVIKTTGRNIRETRKIAQIIQEKYGFV